MDNCTPESPLKRCSKCGVEKPATLTYFCTNRAAKNGLNYACKDCVNTYRNNTKEQQKVYFQQYRLENRERLAAIDKARYPLKRDKDKETRRRRRLENPEKTKQQRHAKYLRLKGLSRACVQRRRTRKLSLPVRWTNQDWLLCLDYWHNTCATCGSQLRDLFGDIEPHADHWIPLNYKGADNPGTVPGNMICLCSDCNLNKFNKLPEQWLSERFGKRKAAEILKRVNSYFELVK